MPWIVRRCCLGSMSGMREEYCCMKWSAAGAMIPENPGAGVVSHVINAQPDPSPRPRRCREVRELAVDVNVLGLCFGESRLAACEPFCSRGQTSQCSTLFQEPPPVRSIGIHDFLP